MSVFTMKMICGSDGTQTLDEIKEFIKQKKVIGIGVPEETRGAGTFQNEMQIGDIVVLRQPDALLKVTSSPTPYQGDGNYPAFDWLCVTRQVEILSWFDEDNEKHNGGIPHFDASGYMATCQRIEAPSPLKTVETWINIIQRTK